MLLSTAGAPCYIVTSEALGFQLLHDLTTSTTLVIFIIKIIIAIQVGMKRYLIVALPCISLMMNDAEHCFRSFLAIRRPSEPQAVFMESLWLLCEKQTGEVWTGTGSGGLQSWWESQCGPRWGMAPKG